MSQDVVFLLRLRTSFFQSCIHLFNYPFIHSTNVSRDHVVNEWVTCLRLLGGSVNERVC